MRNFILSICLLFLLISLKTTQAGNYEFSIKGNKTYLNNQEILVVGLRCSNALFTNQTTDDLINNLDVYKSYGINTVSVFVMGSRFGNIKGYNEDSSLNMTYMNRLAKIIKAADEKGMIILVGCLYWGGSNAKWESWTQKEANRAVANTISWLKENDFRNVFVDVDNEGMAMRGAGFDSAELVRAAKAVDPSICVATNFKGLPPTEADLGVHFSFVDETKPYIQSEGTPSNAPGGYWGKYSREENYENYINIGLYNDSMKVNQIEETKKHFQNGWGYMLASTWLQCVPPYGPNADLGGEGASDNPGVRWWMEEIKKLRGSYIAPKL
ncbi:hypothetical protein [uncultured Draconibacterium sp.]|uniref:hypothetical protein n=1 Tax=uncultured Draconibacterium sp. TaxID=1573823 RepID=UPI0029C834BE|nr:hypothetical protein [uncultured Draconibacterium sp.]